jgi:hypothetical protein
MKAADNLVGLHRFEEDLRAKSLAAIEADTALSDWLALYTLAPASSATLSINGTVTPIVSERGYTA